MMISIKYRMIFNIFFVVVIFSLCKGSSYDKFSGITYNPYENGGNCKQKATIHKDLFLLSNYTQNVRLYAQDCEQTQAILDYCKNQSDGLKFMLGIWVRDNRFESELGSLSKLFENKNVFSSCITSIVVGNEETLNGQIDQSTLIEYILKTKNAVKDAGLELNVLTSEIPKQWTTELIDAVDAVGVNIQPYFGYNNNNMKGASLNALEQYTSIKQKSNKKVIITEIGWPSEGSNKYGASPSIQTQNQFIKNVVCQCSSQNVDYYIFEAFDSNWKKNEDAVEKSFGVFSSTQNTSPKIRLPPYDCN